MHSGALRDPSRDGIFGRAFHRSNPTLPTVAAASQPPENLGKSNDTKQFPLRLRAVYLNIVCRGLGLGRLVAAHKPRVVAQEKRFDHVVCPSLVGGACRRGCSCGLRHGPASGGGAGHRRLQRLSGRDHRGPDQSAPALPCRRTGSRHQLSGRRRPRRPAMERHRLHHRQVHQAGMVAARRTSSAPTRSCRTSSKAARRAIRWAPRR